MAAPDYHAWTHRPKAEGGTDPIEIATSLPFAYTTFRGAVSLDDSEPYTLCAGEGGGYAGTAVGIADSIRIGNDPNQETFYLHAPGTQDALYLRPAADGVYSWEAFVEFAAFFDGAASMYPDTDFNMWDTIDGVTGGSPYHLREWRFFTAGDYYKTLRMSGVAYLAPDTNTGNNGFSIDIVQFSGSAKSVNRGWCLVVKLTGISESPDLVFP